MNKHLFLMTIAVAIAFAGCSKSDDNGGDNNGDNNGAGSALAIDKTAIDATYTAGSYTVAVTSNAAWTAAVEDAATHAWCTLANVSATGNSTVTVNIAGNPAVETRAATVTVASGMLTQQVAVVQQAVSFYAASAQTWTFGAHTWSDAIQMPECDKTSFEESYTDPHCRSYTEGANTWYYYNWAYVTANAAALCPSPWRVPTQSDFNTLVSTLGGNSGWQTLYNAWGYGGYASNTSAGDYGFQGRYWSSTQYPSDTNDAYFLNYYSGNLYVPHTNKRGGNQVRCVK
jgi:uncharacterized protein (TIGR02145 family)